MKARTILTILLIMLSQAGWSATLKVTLDGLEGELLSHVESYLDIFHEQRRDKTTPARVQRLHSKAPEQITTALQVYGYYRVIIDAELIDLPEGWKASYRINKGDAITIGTLDVSVTGEGKDDAGIRKILDSFPLQQGQVFEHPRYEKARDTLIRIAIEQGFLDATLIKRDVTIDLDKYSSSVTLQLETRQRYYFGDVTFSKEVMDENFLKRYVKFSRGEPYSPSRLLALQTTLVDSGYFKQVEVRPVKEHSIADQIPVVVKVELRDRHEWRFGLGYATDTGPRGSINYTSIRGNKGDKFDAGILVSDKRNSLTAAYSIPQNNPVTDQLTFGARYLDETTTSRESTITGLAINKTTAWGEWQRIVGLNYEREAYSIAELPEETVRILYPSVRMIRIRADDRLYTTHGSRVYAELRGANEALLSDTNFGQLRLGLKWIRGITDDSRIILRGDFGSTNVGALEKLPASQRFFAGGDNSVRGYAFEELGPKNSFGEVVGGKHLMVGSIELEHRISGKWSAAAFYDVGNAVNSFGDEVAASAGVGLRWYSPVGPIRLDLAWAQDKPEDRFRLHIVIGPDL